MIPWDAESLLKTPRSLPAISCLNIRKIQEMPVPYIYHDAKQKNSKTKIKNG